MIEAVKFIGLFLVYCILTYLSLSYLEFIEVGIWFSLLYVVLVSFFFKFNSSSFKKKDTIFFKLLISILLLYLFSMSFDVIYRDDSFQHRTHLSMDLSELRNVYYVFLFIVIIGPIYEEFFFRSVLLSFFRKERLVVGVLVISILFSLTHFLIFPIFVDFYKLINLFLLGLLLSYIRVLGNLFLAILAHSFYNALILLKKFEIVDLFFLDYLPNGVYFTLGYCAVLFVFFGLCFLLYRNVFKLDQN